MKRSERDRVRVNGVCVIASQPGCSSIEWAGRSQGQLNGSPQWAAFWRRNVWQLEGYSRSRAALVSDVCVCLFSTRPRVCVRWCECVQRVVCQPYSQCRSVGAVRAVSAASATCTYAVHGRRSFNGSSTGHQRVNVSSVCPAEGASSSSLSSVRSERPHPVRSDEGRSIVCMPVGSVSCAHRRSVECASPAQPIECGSSAVGQSVSPSARQSSAWK